MRNARPSSIEMLISATVHALQKADIENPDTLARHILGEATQWSPAQILLNAKDIMPTEALPRYNELLARACAHEPLSRILNEREFYGHTFKINEATLDPRADTETLIDAALELADENGWRNRPFRFLDIGTGSGCIAITLLAQLPNSRAVATDISQDALDAAKQNAINHGVGNRLELIQRESLSQVDGTFDLLVSNPPYIPSSDIPALSPEVRNYDPIAALDGGPDGLEIYRQIANGLNRVVPNGWAAFEIGAGQADDVLNILRPVTISRSRRWRDLPGHTRCVAIKTHCE